MAPKSGGASVRMIGITWYARRDYPRVLQLMDDASELDETYDAWLKNAQNAERELRRQGHKVVRTKMDLDAFLAWCTVRGERPIGGARAEWSSEVAGRQTR
jgi:hypothetical protein